ncbi:hypothetical protein AN964_14145 [Heyndrickxia shackletonii]|uniref:Uncharacterized protein n=1 Tax=Heyndrickxia shackletonii TaxID=157838 RepID=A0A0Q3WZC6_9BACI|nr:hypothetical protein [Heyndrickxia shackletonii]KQL54522.1 hypothetical protein AN964_14145 [Heyndrickxia shackletonii]NEZ02052.1 hypothetical protein [Heyndrickxia shackletonii]
MEKQIIISYDEYLDLEKKVNQLEQTYFSYEETNLILHKVLDYIKDKELDKDLVLYLMAVMNDPKQRPVFPLW